MTSMDSIKFKEALIKRDLDALRKIPKADLHNHFVLGGNRAFLKEKTGKLITPITAPLESMDAMHAWVGANMGQTFHTSDMRKLLIEATFVQANRDGVKILEVGEDVWGLAEYFEDDMDQLIGAFHQARVKFAPNTTLRLQIGLSRHCSIPYLERVLEPFWGRPEFYSIDLYGDEFAQPIDRFKNIYRKAKANGLKVKAHVGEWGGANDIKEAIQLLDLDEIQHGISAVDDPYTMDLIKERKIRLNITPTSNVLLGRVEHIRKHPIRKLFDEGIDVTINSDDILIFDSDVSKEFMRLYTDGVFDADELDFIRVNGLMGK